MSRNENTIFHKTDKYRVECEYRCDDYGVFTRNDSFTNISNEDINVNCLKSRFVFEGGEYQVYAQFNHWPSDNESPYDEMRIYKDTILRLPPQAMEKMGGGALPYGI